VGEDSPPDSGKNLSATVDPVSGVGIAAHDIVWMTEQMMRDMLAEPALADRTAAFQWATILQNGVVTSLRTVCAGA
jgi:hypothetical protein